MFLRRPFVPRMKGVDEGRLAAAIRSRQHNEPGRFWDTLDGQVRETPKVLNLDAFEFHARASASNVFSVRAPSPGSVNRSSSSTATSPVIRLYSAP